MVHSCVRCPSTPVAFMAFDYDAAEVWIDDAASAPERGHGYFLCGPCADKMTPPLSWRLSDRRYTTRLFAPAEVA